MAIVQVLQAALLYWMIDEPTTMNESEERHQKKKSIWGRLWSLLKLALKACRKDHALLVALIATIPTRTSSQLTQVNF